MRIQHNIMAMSAYRNYTNNVSAMKKNLEKLSSGYKINRAGDDAAGLAISEKMRAQITGLETAQKNAKDGISLVQTAEGALTEVHDMLNRMVTLATQSANGTYDNETDRAQMQKELDQLRSEIDRIADSTNFNGINLLDGSLEAAESTYEIANAADLEIEDATKAGSTDVSKLGLSTIIHADGKDKTKTTFKVELQNLSFFTTGADDTANKCGVSVGGTTITVSLKKDTELKGAALASALATSANAMSSGNGFAIGNVTYNVTSDGSTLIFTMTDASLEKASKKGVATSFTGDFKVDIDRTNATVKGTVNTGTQVVVEGNPERAAILANTYTEAVMTSGDIKDGAAFTFGDTTYVFATNAETKAAVEKAGFKAVDISDIVDASGKLDDSKIVGTAGDALSEALTRLTVAAKDNEMFTVGVNANKQLTFQEKTTFTKGKELLSSRDDIQKQIQKGTFTEKTSTPAKGSGTGLQLQIGDTADDFNQLKVSIKDCHVASMGGKGQTISSISIANQQSAQSAVDVIKDAINYISDVRGTLGATQNRLDHTINNLSVMTENIQDAESTIRDTDVAEEMMAYTKNNILIQSAQAMLAQANQVPQGVLQLLQ